MRGRLNNRTFTPVLREVGSCVTVHVWSLPLPRPGMKYKNQSTLAAHGTLKAFGAKREKFELLLKTCTVSCDDCFPVPVLTFSASALAGCPVFSPTSPDYVFLYFLCISCYLSKSSLSFEKGPESI